MNEKKDLLDNLIDQAMPSVIEQLSKDIPAPKEDHVFSEMHEARMKKLFMQERRKPLFRNSTRYLSYAAAMLLLVVSTATIGMFMSRTETLEPQQQRGLGIFPANQAESDMEIDASVESLRLADDIFTISIPSATGSTNEAATVNLGYVPEGFILKETEVVDGRIFALFAMEERHFTVLIDNPVISPLVESRLDAGAGAIEIEINEHEAIHTTDDEGINVVAWSDNEHSFSIAGNLDEEEIIRIASGLEINE
jgi:hypothetical protein